MTDPRLQSVGIIGSGAPGLITAYTLIKDGFVDVKIITRDSSVGGVFAAERVYPDLLINNVHGEYRFSALPMPPPSGAKSTGGRLTGGDMQAYFENFANTFLDGKIHFETEVLRIRRDAEKWALEVEDKKTHLRSTWRFARIVVCTGGASTPNIPKELSPQAEELVNFKVPVVHSSQFRSREEEVLDISRSSEDDATVVVVGGGKSAQDIATYLTNQGRKVTMVFEKADAFLAVPTPLPDFIRKSRLLGVLSPHIELRTRLERFLHTTTVGSMLVRSFWNFLAWSSFKAFGIPNSSPLHNAHDLFWGVRTNDEGVGRPKGFHNLVKAGAIKLFAPARVTGYGQDGRSIIVNDKEKIVASAVILATGYTSSWSKIFDENTVDYLGLSRHPPSGKSFRDWDHYKTIRNPPHSHSEEEQWASSIYRGIVPAKNITRRDFAINGAIFSTNPGYVFELSSHWISSYFLGDKMRLPSSAEEALNETERYAAWIRKRHPDMLRWSNESYSGEISFWTWPQTADEMLEDMGVKSMRSGGNWFTWPFKVMGLHEIETLGEKRRVKRLALT